MDETYGHITSLANSLYPLHMQDQLAEMLPSGFRWCRDSNTHLRGDKEASAATAGFTFA